MKNKKHNLSEDDYGQLKENFYITYQFVISNSQIDKLLTLYPEWNGKMDVDGVADVMNGILKTFVHMDIPLFESSDKDKKEWDSRILSSKPAFIKFISSVQDHKLN